MKIDMGKITLDMGGCDKGASRPSRLKWDMVTPTEIAKYTEETERQAANIEINHSLMLCSDGHCNNESHRCAIKKLYNDITLCLKEASEPLKQPVKRGYKQILGWNDVCKEAHSIAREAFLQWAYAGKPRQGYLFDSMKQSRARFKLCLRQCRFQEKEKSRDSLAKNLLGKDSKTFWKEVKSLNGSGSTPLSSTVGGAVGHEQIASMWHDHYKSLLNSSKDIRDKAFVLGQFKKISENNFSFDCYFKPHDIHEAIKDLKPGKAVGRDYLASEHIKYSCKRITILISLLFNCCIAHGYLPVDMLDTVIVPLIKDKKGDITDKDNYRPIALTTILSKLFEIVILNMYDHLLVTSPNLFGFKKGSSTDGCIFALKQIIDHYRSLSSPIYLAFLDASKAFDKVNHWSLFRKLLERGLPIILVRLLYIWYSTQFFYVRWGNTQSPGFNVCNGVRQGSVISPVYFNIYIDDLSKILVTKRCGCNINGININHLIYADDTVLIAPSPHALQKLICYCEYYADHNEMSYNVKKSKIMCIQPKGKLRFNVPDFKLNSNVIDVVSAYKYLGFYLSNDMKDDTDINRQIRGLYTRGNIVIKCFKHCTEPVKILLFKTYCCNMYCSHLWSNYTNAVFRKLKTSFNRVYRMLMNLERRTSVSQSMLYANVHAFDIIVRNYMYNFKTRLEKSDNLVIDTLLKSFHYSSSDISVMWQKKLYM